MNTPYFSIEDRLFELATKSYGVWSLQTGFEFSDHPQAKSKSAFSVLSRQSPYDDAISQFVSDTMQQQPTVVGICVAAEQQIIPALQIAFQLRSAGFEGRIILGGNIVSRLADEMAIAPMLDLLDGLIVFQGEIPLLRYCEAVRSSASFERVPNLIWRDKFGIHKNPFANLINPDHFPTPNYEDLPIGKYAGTNYLNVVAARGCYYGKCSFCAIPFGWGANGYAGQRGVERVVQDIIVQSRRHGMRRFKFVDEALSPSFMRSFSEQILDCGLQIEWEGYTRLEAAWNDPDFVRLIAKAGFRKGYFGLEILPSEGRRELNKRDSAEPEVLLGLCSDNGVKVHFFCMFGYPGTGVDDAVRTVDFLRENNHRIDTADIFPWTLAKHTKVPGIRPIFENGSDWALEFDHVGDDSSVMSSGQIRELVGHLEEILWQDVPRLLHPVYRLVSPWSATPVRMPDPNTHAALILT